MASSKAGFTVKKGFISRHWRVNPLYKIDQHTVNMGSSSAFCAFDEENSHDEGGECGDDGSGAARTGHSDGDSEGDGQERTGDSDGDSEGEVPERGGVVVEARAHKDAFGTERDAALQGEEEDQPLADYVRAAEDAAEDAEDEDADDEGGSGGGAAAAAGGACCLRLPRPRMLAG
jgi:hypothetical protein